jgi:LL-diaminopimelate aminotransferase
MPHFLDNEREAPRDKPVVSKTALFPWVQGNLMSTPADPWIQSLFAERIGGANYGKDTKIYKFEKIKRAKRAALAAHPERQLLDFGIGENDDMAPPLVRDVLKREVDRIENRGYADNGIAAFKEAAAEFMRKVFSVTLDPVTEINHAIGSKPAYAMLPAVFINPGDVTLMTVPGYPVAGTHTRYYGGEVYPLPLKAENGFCPDLAAIPADIRRRAKMMVINYPNSPTGATATRDFYRRVIDFAHTNQVVIVQDAAHILLSYDGPPLSFLQVEGAKEVGIEIHSMSKGFNMIGWRMGFVAGHPKIVQAFADVKDNCDSGQFMAIQHAAAAALRLPKLADDIREKYRRRLQKLVTALTRVGFQVKMPSGTYFLYAPAPTGCAGQTFTTAEEASQFLIGEQSVCCVPWDDAGAFLRFSVTYQAKDEDEENALMAQTVERLGKLRLRFD